MEANYKQINDLLVAVQNLRYPHMFAQTTNKTGTKAETIITEEHLVRLEEAFDMKGTLLRDKKSFNPKKEPALETC